MANLSLLKELVSTHAWMMRKDAFEASKSAILANIANPVDFDEETFRNHISGFFAVKSQGFRNILADHDGDDDDDGWNEKRNLVTDEEFINILNVCGPVTRNGGACSFGSREHRDQIMRAADMENCLGHIFIIDTPGGSAWAKNDYLQAIDYAHSKKQPVVAFIDGDCCSAGMYLASMCDRIFFMNPEDTIGCIGVMANFFTIKDGDVNTITQERFCELYAETSPDKNIEFRDAANGDYTKLQAEINALGEEFKSFVLSHRPGATEEHVTGKVFPARLVTGSLVDQQGTFSDAVDYVLHGNHIGNQESPKTPESPESPETPDGKCDPDKDKCNPDKDKCNPDKDKCNPDKDKCDPDKDKCNPDKKEQTSVSATNTQTTMSKNYSRIQKALNLEAMESDTSNGLYLNESLAEQLDEALAKAEQTQLSLDAKMTEITALNASIASLKAEQETVIASLKEENEKAIANLGAEHEAALAQKAEEISNLSADHEAVIAQKDEEISALNSQLSALNETLAQKDEEIKTLSENAPAAPAPAVPQPSAAGKQTDAVTESIYSPDMTRAERRAARQARMSQLRS